MCVVNLKFRESSVNGYCENFVFKYTGQSMLAIDRRTFYEPATIEANKADLKENILSRGPNKHQFDGEPLFVVSPYHSKEFVAALKSVNPFTTEITFEFLNTDKTLYPDVVLRSADIRAIYEVVRITIDLDKGLPCHCASDGEYCGPGCVNSELKSLDNER